MELYEGKRKPDASNVKSYGKKNVEDFIKEWISSEEVSQRSQIADIVVEYMKRKAVLYRKIQKDSFFHLCHHESWVAASAGSLHDFPRNSVDSWSFL